MRGHMAREGLIKHMHNAKKSKKDEDSSVRRTNT
jgi:hypothetical protein